MNFFVLSGSWKKDIFLSDFFLWRGMKNNLKFSNCIATSLIRDEMQYDHVLAQWVKILKNVKKKNQETLTIMRALVNNNRVPGLHYPCSSRPIQQFLVIYFFSFLEHSKYVVVVQLLLLPTWKVRDFGKGQKFVETSYLSLLIKGNFRIWYILPYLIIYDMKFTILMMFFEIFFFLSKGEQIRAFRDSTSTSS